MYSTLFSKIRRLSSGHILTALILGGLLLGWVLTSPEQPKTPESPVLLAKEKPSAQAKAEPKMIKFAQNKPRVRPDLDLREFEQDSPTKAGRRAALAELQRAIPGVQVEFDPLSGAPSRVQATGKMLTEPAPGKSARQVVEQFVERYQALFGHSGTSLTEARVAREDVTAHNGMSTLVWQQQFDDIPLYKTILKANVTKHGELVTVSDSFLSNPQQAARKTEAQRKELIRKPPVDAEKAVAKAAASWDQQVAAVQSASEASGTERQQSFSAQGLSDTKAHLTWMPMSSDRLVLAWDVTTFSLPENHMYRVVVDAESGKVLHRTSLTVDISDATYQVYAKSGTFQPFDSPTPMAPGLTTPSGTQPAAVARQTLTLPALNTTASPDGWINDGGMETLGNNVDAHTDTDDDNAPDLPRPNGGAGRNFSFPMDLGLAPSTYKDASVTQLFYLNNYIHDRLYELGFTESAGNFQTNNFGRGGLGNDAVQADAQDGGGTDNANFSTPPDGSPGRMQMYAFSGPNPDRDGDFDAEIVVHEYVHGLSNRLVGGGVGIDALQSAGMGEGWSDFYALCLLSEPGDDPNANYAAGGYATYQLGGSVNNYYFGIRRYPYSTNLLKNPLTLRDIDPSQASAHTGIPNNPIFGPPNGSPDEVHNQGEVWCVTLWEARANLIAKHGHAMGNERILQVVTDGMKLAPANPTFLQARDAVIQADLVNNGGADSNELWAAFAKRGMGASATVPAVDTTFGVVESYEMPDDLRVSPTAPLAAEGQVGGPMTPETQQYTLLNSGTANLNWTATASKPWVTLSAPAGSLAPGATVQVTATINSQANNLPPGDHVTTVAFTNVISTVVIQRSITLHVDPILVPIFTEDFESGTLGSAWTLTGTGSWRTLNTAAGGPHAGARHLTMDSSVNDNYSRNEATLTLDLEGRENVRLSFYAKGYNEEPDGPAPLPFPSSGADFDGVAISDDGGANWYEVKELTSLTNGWGKHVVDLDAAIVAHGLNYGPNFKIRFNHYDNYSIDTDGIAIDDIQVAEEILNQIQLSAPESLIEGGSAGTVTMTVTPVPSTDLTVTLASDSADATVPANVVIQANSGSTTFAITPVDDTLLDGSQTVTITATATDFPAAAASLLVHDNETANLAVTIPAVLTEGDLNVQGTVNLSAPAGKAVRVYLTSSSPSNLAVPASVVVAVGQSSATLPITVVNDLLLDGAQPVTITAHVHGWTDGSDATVVNDNELSTLAVTLPLMREGDTELHGTVTAGGVLISPLNVALLSSDAGEAAVPVSVTIQAGTNSAVFDLSVVDDEDQDGVQPVTISASAAGFTPGSAIGSVADNEVHHYSVVVPPGLKIRGAPIPLTITALDVNGAVITNSMNPVDLSAEGSEGPLTITPVNVDAFTGGIWSGSVVIEEFANQVVVTATDVNGKTGSSLPFNVGTGEMDHFVWDPFGTNQMEDQPFIVTARSVDLGGNPVIDFQGSATIGVKVPGMVEALVWGGYSNLIFDLEYDQTIMAAANYYSNFNPTQSRAFSASQLANELEGKHVLLIPAQSNASPGDMAALGTAWSAVLTNFVQNGGVVIVCSYDGDEHGLLATSGLMTLTKGSTAASLNLTQPLPSDLTQEVTTPFVGSEISTYTASNGETVLRSVADGNPVVLSRPVGSGRAVMIGTNFTTVGTEMDRVVANAVRLGERTASPLLPVRGEPANFVNGVWTGEVAVPFPASSIFLTARTAAGKDSLSDPFDVQELMAPIPDGTTIFTENFESGVLSSAWTVSGTGPHRTQITTANTPYGGSKHLIMDSSEDGTYARNEATLTLNLEEKSGVILSFRVKSFNDENHLPPDTGIDSSGADFDGVAISGDGGETWYEVQPLRELFPTYDLVTVDLDSAAGSVGLPLTNNFKIRFNHYDNHSIPADGFAIDDIMVTAEYSDGFGVRVPALAGEADGTLTGTITLNGKREHDMLVVLASSRPLKASVPDSVVIPAGELEATFPITLTNDDVLEGDRRVTFTASPFEEQERRASMTIVDDETTTVTVSAPASLDEGFDTYGRVRLGATPLGPIRVTLTSSDPENFILPESVVLPGGVRSDVFPIFAADNAVIDIGRSETVTAGIIGGSTDSSQVLINDNESHDIYIAPPDFVDEGGTATGVVNLQAVVTAPLTLTLTSANPARMTVPATVTIPAGQDHASFLITAPNNALVEGELLIGISANAPTFASYPAEVLVRDNEVHHYVIDPIPNPQIVNAPISLHVQAFTIDDVPANLSGAMLTVSAASSTGPVTPVPLSVGPFVGSELNATVQIPSALTGVTLTLTDTGLVSATSNVFDTVIGGLHHFTWSTVPSPQMKGQGFTATLNARDAGGTLLTDYNGEPLISAHTPGGDVVTGDFETYVEGPFAFDRPVVRSQSIYLPAEVGPARKLRSLGLDMQGLPYVPIQNFTVRVKHTTKADYESAPTWEGSGWTTVYTGTLNVTDIGWLTLPFSTPFAYNGTDNLMVDISFQNAKPAGGYSPIGGYCSGKFTPTMRSLRLATYPEDGDPLTWMGDEPGGAAEAALVNLQFLGISYPVTPVSATLVNGTWTGTVTLNASGEEVVLEAVDADVRGSSNVFAVNSLGALVVALPATATEGSLPLNGTVTLPEARLVDTEVTLTSSAPGQAAPSTPSVTIPAGNLSAPFQMILVDDADSDGSQSVKLTASSPRHDDGVQAILVHDNDPGSLSMELPTDVNESDLPGTHFGMVMLPFPAPADIVVSLTCSHPTQFTVPATVTIPLGETTAPFELQLIDDLVPEALQTVTVTASVIGWPDATGTTQVHDDEFHHFTFIEIPSPQTPDLPIIATIVAVTSDEMPVPISGPVTITASGANGPIPVRSDPFMLAWPPVLVDGYWSGPISLNRADTGVRLTATKGTITGTSNAFDIVNGGPHHFAWATVPALQMKGVPFTTTLTARDVGGNLVPDYTGEVTLSAHNPGADVVTGALNSYYGLPFNATNRVSRTQSIYLPSEIGPARQIRNLTFSMPAWSGGTHTFTIRLKHTNRSLYGDDISWESTGWTTVYHGPVSMTDVGLLTLPFSEPFAYNGTSNLMVDMSFQKTGLLEGENLCEAAFTEEPRTLWAVSDDPGSDPLTWATELPTGQMGNLLPILRFEGISYPVLPETVTMVNGTWTGEVTVLGSGDEIVLDAMDPSPLQGSSNTFSVQTIGALTMTLPATSLEGDLPIAGTVTLPAIRAVDTLVTLTSSAPTQAVVSPPSFTIPAGSLAGNFSVNIVDDLLNEGTQKVSITADTNVHEAITKQVSIDDNESPVLTVDVPVDMTEGEGAFAHSGTVSIPVPADAPVVVTLSSSDISELTVPATVIIPQGYYAVSFPITVMDDALTDGAQPAAITAHVENWTNGTDTTTVHDNDLHHFTLATVPSPQQSDIPFSISAEARTVEDLLIPDYAGTVTLSAAGSGGQVNITPITPAVFIDGSLVMDVICTTARNNVRITMSDGLGHIGLSSLFTVQAGVAHHFDWSTIPSPQIKDLPVTATLTALDAGGNLASSYSGTVELFFFHPSAVTETGSGDTATGLVLSTSSHDARLQSIYPPEDVGAARTLNSLAFNVVGLPGQTLKAFTVRMKHSPKTSYDPNSTWESTGWTTVYQGNLTVTQVGWLTLPLSVPFEYNGTDSLMVDFSFNNTSATVDGAIMASYKPAARSLYYMANSTAGNPLQWAGSVPPPYADYIAPALRFQGGLVEAAPLTVEVVNGVFTGSVAVPGQGSGIRLYAREVGNPLFSGYSNAFQVNTLGSLAMTLPVSTATEGGAAVSGTVTLSAPQPTDTVVTFSSSPEPEDAAFTSETLTILAGATSAPFSLSALDDTELDGTRAITLKAKSPGFADGSAPFTTTDNDVGTLSLDIPTAVTEGDGLSFRSVSITPVPTYDVTVTLSSSDTSELSVPATVTVLAGEGIGYIPVNVEDDTQQDGAQNVTITASVPTWANATATTSVRDNELHHFALSNVTSPQQAGVPISLTASARSVDDVVINNFFSSVLFTAAGTSGPLDLTPYFGFFNAGVFSGLFTTNTADTQVIITMDDSHGHVAQTAPFDVNAGPVHHFSWSTIPSPQYAGLALTPTVIAKDTFENRVTSYTGNAAIQQVVSSPPVVTGTGTGTFEYPLFTFYHDARTQCIYTPAEVGTARLLTSLDLDVASFSSQMMNAFTIRMKHTSKANYSGAGNASWDSSGWTTVYQANRNINATGWNNFTFSAPFSYDGTSNLMVDISFNNSFYTTNGLVRATNVSSIRALTYYSDSNSGDPLTWSGTSPSGGTHSLLPNLRFPGNQTITTLTNAAFTAGAWTGNVTLPAPESAVTLRALDGTITGSSNSFAVLAPETFTLSIPVTTGTEGGAALSGTVSIAAPRASNTVITLSSSDTSEAAPTTPTVTITAGATSASFSIQMVDDDLLDGPQPVLITATSPGFLTQTASLTVNDNESASLHHFAISTISSPQTAGTAFSITVTARTSADTTYTGFTGTAGLSAATANGSPLILSPGTSTAFVNGVWTGNVTVGQAGMGVILTANDGAGHTGTSNSFNVLGTASWFDVSAIPATVTSGTSTPVTITARDSAGQTDTSFTGQAQLISRAPGLGQLLVGKGVTNSTTLLSATSHDCRTQTIFTATQMGERASRLNGMAVNVVTTAGTVFNSFTVRLRHSTKTTYSTGGAAWESTGWTTVYTANQTFSSTGWLNIPFSVPFDYNGTDSLMLDISFDNSATGTFVILRSDATDSSMMLFGTSNSAHGAPTTWTGSTALIGSLYSVPQVKFLVSGDVALSPQIATPFVSGVWTGNVTFNGAANDLTLVVLAAAGRIGVSNAFALLPPAVTLNAEPSFTGGISNPLSWSASAGASSYGVQASTSTDFASPVWTATPTTTSTTATDLVHGALYHFRARAQTSVSHGDDAWTQTEWGDFASDSRSSTSADLLPGSVTLSAGSSASTTTTENFNALSGGAWTSLLPVTGGNTGFALTSSPLNAGPNTTPELPINQGGDFEGRLTGSVVWALGPNDFSGTFSDGYIDAYLCAETPASPLSGGLLIRTTTNFVGIPIGYLCTLRYTSPTTATVDLAYSASGTLANSSSFAVSTADIIRLRFTAKGPLLMANAWKVAVVGGVVTETPITLVTATSSPNLIAYDTRYSVGRAGIRASAGAGAFLVEDITISMDRPVYAASGTVTSPVIAPSVRSQWGALTFSGDTSAPGTSLTVDVLDSTGAVLATNVASGTNLNSVGVVAPVSAIKLRANLATTNSANTPVLHQWSVAYTSLPGLSVASAWSPTVSSTQDAQAPVINATALHTSAASANLTGNAADSVSGVASVTVNSLAATTSDGYANWTRNVAGLVDGTNNITVQASDNAVPPNTSTLNTFIYRISTPDSDTNGNGIPFLIEHALGIPAGAANPHSMLPATGSQTDSGTRYLTMQYRRRIQRAGLQYHVDTSTNLVTWDLTGADVQEISVVPTGDGVTELVTIRITPAMTIEDAKFVRLRVITN